MNKGTKWLREKYISEQVFKYILVRQMLRGFLTNLIVPQIVFSFLPLNAYPRRGFCGPSALHYPVTSSELPRSPSQEGIKGGSHLSQNYFFILILVISICWYPGSLQPQCHFESNRLNSKTTLVLSF